MGEKICEQFTPPKKMSLFRSCCTERTLKTLQVFADLKKKMGFSK